MTNPKRYALDVQNGDDNSKRLKDPVMKKNAGLDSFGTRTGKGYPPRGSGSNDVPNPGSTSPLALKKKTHEGGTVPLSKAGV
jgi:hypothetical protein